MHEKCLPEQNNKNWMCTLTINFAFSTYLYSTWSWAIQKIYTLVWIKPCSLIQHKYNNEMFNVRRMGRYMVSRFKDNNPISKKGQWGPPGKLKNFQTHNFKLIVAAVIWLKYCRYAVKRVHYPINQWKVDPVWVEFV